MRARSIDVGVAVLLAAVAIGLLAAGVDTNGVVPARSYVIAGVAGLALVARRDLSIAVLLFVGAARLFVAWDVGDDVALRATAAVAIFTTARHGDRWPRVVIASLVGLVVAFGTASFGDDPILVEGMGELAQNLLPVAVADALRTRAERMRDLINAEAESRVQAERLRIARDLHDVVAHGLSTIAIQSGVAAHLIDEENDQAKGALNAINAASRSSLDELRGLLGVLRSTDDAQLRPTPSEPDNIGEILAAARDNGVAVNDEVTGSFPVDASDAAVVAVHRIVEEALTNVSRHAGPVAATVRLRHGPTGVDIAIRNERPAEARQPVASTGVGIVGMRERAESLGGSLAAGPTSDGGYQVIAQVPYGTRSS